MKGEGRGRYPEADLSRLLETGYSLFDLARFDFVTAFTILVDFDWLF